MKLKQKRRTLKVGRRRKVARKNEKCLVYYLHYNSCTKVVHNILGLDVFCLAFVMQLCKESVY